MENIQNQGADPNEIQQEEVLMKEPNHDEVRASIISEMGLDEELDKDIIDKFTQKEIDHRKKLSTAIAQKRTWREKATSKPAEEAKPQTIDENAIIQKFRDEMENKEIDSLELSDELKTEVRLYAKSHNVSIKNALNSPVIQYMKSEEDKKARAEEASISGTDKSVSKKNYADMNPSDFDLSTDEGRKGWTEYKNWLKTQ